MKFLPKITIIIPSYNQVSFLTRALDSLANQEYPNLEVIVVDGGSTDGTVDLLKVRTDIVNRWVSGPDKGQTNALNKGFAVATGEVFAWLNCDERYLPGALHLIGEAFEEDPKLDIVFGQRIVVDQEGREIERMKLPAIHPGKYALYASGLLFSDTTFWKADIHRRTGVLDEVNCGRYAMDFDWFARLGLNVKKWERLDAYISEFTEYPGRVSKNVAEMSEIAYQIRKRVQQAAGISPLRVIFWSPLYFFLSRYGRLGWRGLLKPPSPISLLRVAGIVR
jgi:glycosyltransferase involved in cell wall biosynthesis